MEALLTKVSRRQAVCLAVGDREVALTCSIITPLGPRALESRVEPFGDDGPGPVVRDLIGSVSGTSPWRKAPVVIGLPGLGVYFSARPATSRAASPAAILNEALDTINVPVDDLEFDAVPLPVADRPTLALAASRKTYLGPILDALVESGRPPSRVEPVPCALLRTAARHRPPKKSRAAVRVFLGDGSGLAVLTAASGLPLGWRPFALEPGREAQTIRTQFRLLDELAARRELGVSPDALLIHGRPDLGPILDAVESAPTPVAVGRFDDPGLNSESVALGLALGLDAPEPALNLARALRPADPILSLLPWVQIAVQVLLLAGATFIVHDHLQQMESAHTATIQQLADYPWLDKTTNAELLNEKKALAARVEALKGFLADRISWASCTREVASRLAPEMIVTSMDGRCEYQGDKRKSSKRINQSLSVSLEAPIPESVSVPPEIDNLLRSLRTSPALKRSLPLIEMSSLRWNMSGQTKAPKAIFTVMCLPGSAESRKAKAGAARPDGKDKPRT